MLHITSHPLKHNNLKPFLVLTGQIQIHLCLNVSFKIMN